MFTNIKNTMETLPKLTTISNSETVNSTVDDFSWRYKHIIAPKWRLWTLDKDDNSSPAIRDFIVKWIDDYPAMREKNAGIRFHGTAGSGKSFYAACIANEIIRRYNVNVMMISVPMLADIRLGKIPELEYAWNYSMKCQLLVLDDVGAEAETSYRQETLFSIIDSRNLMTNAITIITTNLSSEELSKPYGNITIDRTYSRISELCPIPITMNGKDHRIAISKEIKKSVKETLG